MAKKKKIVNENKFENGLTDALLGNRNPWAMEQLSQTGTIEKNLRYYMISNLRTVLSWAYLEIGLVRTICDIPVEDGLRGGIEIKTKQLDPEEIENLIAEMEEQNDLGVACEAGKWDRLYGGSGIIIVTDEDPASEFRVDEIKEGSPLAFKSADLWELFWAQNNTQAGIDLLNINSYNLSKTFSYYGIEISKSRVMTMKGLPAPSFLRPTLRGWGASVIETLVRSINQYLKTNDLIFEVLDEFKLDVYKLKNLANTLLQKDGTQKIQQRVQLANLQKNYQNALVLDAEDDHSSKELSFAGIADTMTGIRMQVASDMRIPLTKLFGISAAGFSSGEDDIENYNAMIESTIRSKLKFHLLKMVKLRCKQKYGFIPDDLSISFKPLRILSAEQEESVKTSKFNRILQAAQTGFCTAKEFKEACNKDDLLPIQLDTNIDKIEIESDAETSAESPTASEKRQAPKAKEAE